MKKKFIFISIIIFCFFLPTTIHGSGSIIPDPVADGFDFIIGHIGYFMIWISSWLLGISGWLLKWSIKYTIVDWASHINGMNGINITWKFFKDLMNIVFIFYLIYYSIMLIIGQETRAKIFTFIGKIVIVALLINFSLFFTKVMIDVSNTVTIGMYKTIVGNQTQDVDISDMFMQSLNLSNIYNETSLDDFAASQNDDGWSMFLVGSIGSVLFVIVSFSFLAVSVLFTVRYGILIFLLMTAAFGYIKFVLPEIGKKGGIDWWTILTGQLLFPPIYMILTWACLTLIGTKGFLTAGGAPTWTGLILQPAKNPGSIELLFNFALIIFFINTILVVSKSFASQGTSMMGNWVGKATAFAGGAVFGGTAWLGRTSIGRAGNAISNNLGLQEAANKSGFRGSLARASLYTAQKARSGSFDLRNATVPTSVVGDVIQGTVGRTRAGKFLGLNDVNIPNVGSVGEIAGSGKGGTKGFKETKAESDKRVKERETTQAKELKEVKDKKSLEDNKKKIEAGANLPPEDPKKPLTEDQKKERQKTIDEMTVALSKVSEKEIEEMVASNKKLLDSQEFANSISVKQLEALNKSELIAKEQKDKLNKSRFGDVIDEELHAELPRNATAEEKRKFEERRNSDEFKKKIEKMETAMSRMSDKELEILVKSNKNILGSERFATTIGVDQLKAINKSTEFTETEKTSLNEKRFEKIKTSLSAAKNENRELTKDEKKRISKLADDEITLIDADYLKDDNFIEAMKQSQVDYVTKSSKFIASQKDRVREGRLKPLRVAFATRTPENDEKIKKIMKDADAKTIANLIKEDSVAKQRFALDTVALSTYNVKKLKKIADAIEDDDDLEKLKIALIGSPEVNDSIKKWLNSEEGQKSFGQPVSDTFHFPS